VYCRSVAVCITRGRTTGFDQSARFSASWKARLYEQGSRAARRWSMFSQVLEVPRLIEGKAVLLLLAGKDEECGEWNRFLGNMSASGITRLI
jgi:hypothetical protein